MFRSTLRRNAVGLAVCLVSILVPLSTASASSGHSITNGVTLITATGTLTFTAGGLNESCTVRFGIRLPSSIAKARGVTIGSVLPSPSSSFSNCAVSSSGAFLGGITVSYTTHSGTLPNITQIVFSFDDLAFLLNFPIFGSCLYQGAERLGTTSRFTRNTSTRALTSLSLLGEALSDGLCPQPAEFGGTFTVNATQPLVQLI
jgi:hypothetical protein